MASGRSRRATAGNRMSKLIEEQAEDETADDEFYKTTYGGFNEEEVDDDYEEEEGEEDEVDSDFDMSEKEDEGGEDSEDDTKKKKVKKKNFVPKPKSSSSSGDKPKKPAAKRVYEPVVPVDKRERMRASTVMKGDKISLKKETIKRHPKMPQMRRLTQEELLAEAKITQEKNLASLAQFLKLEEEKKKNKITKVRYQGPIVRFQSTRVPFISDNPENKGTEQFCTRNFLEFTDTKNFPKDYFPAGKMKYPDKAICVVTGLPAKYKDPLTGLSYATIEAFKFIRQHRKRIREERLLKRENMKKRKKKEPAITS